MPKIGNQQNLRKQFRKHLAALFIPIATITLFGAYSIFKSETDVEKIKTRTSERATIHVGERAINSIIQVFITDLTYLASEDGLLNLINSELPEQYQQPPADWPVFSEIKGIYDQIRWLDMTGQERVRVNYNNSNPTLVPMELLQNKSGRYYFTDTVKLKHNEFFISPFDLNIENGKVEKPEKPMLRIGTPVFNNKGEKKGIVLLNYFGGNMLSELNHMMSTSSSNSWLVNLSGHWLKGPSTELEWGFMYGNEDASMQNYYSSAWRNILSSDHDQFEDENGLWTYTTIYPLIESVKQSKRAQKVFTTADSNFSEADYFWKLVLFRPVDSLYESAWKKATKYLLATLVLLSVMFSGSWRLASAWSNVEKTRNKLNDLNQQLERKVNDRTRELVEARKQAEKLARTDELSGLNNRRSFLYLGKVIQEQTKRNESKYSIIMLDIDFFKKINDTHGHGIGDKAIRAVGRKIKAIIRETDIAGRIGGEEFGVILPETDSEMAVALAEKLRIAFTEIAVTTTNTTVKLTASLGIADSKPNFSLDDIMTRADSALYKAKDQGRNRVIVSI
ncbi:MAG: diguanylate cyclase [Gammaproteobacteria bacterium]|nr:diguanylate cyclase [Gammaproteobacteria bacterium]